MSAPRRAYRFSEFCAWGLVGSCAALALVGVLGMFTSDVFGIDSTAAAVAALAFVMAFAILQINNMSEAAMQAIDRPLKQWHWPTLIPALFCVVVFAVASNIGVHLGWEVLAASAVHPERLPDAETVGQIFLVLSVAKPLSMLAVAGRKAMDQARLAAAEAAEQARHDRNAEAERANRHAENLARIEAQASAASASQNRPASSEGRGENRPRGQRPKLVKTLANAAAGGLLLMGAAGAAGEAQARPASAEGEPAPRAETEPKVGPAQRAKAKAMIAAGANAKQAHRETGVPYSTCKAWKADFLAGLWAA